MPSRKADRIVIDTNVWISFLIGKTLHGLKRLIVEGKIQIVLSDQLIDELVLVSSRPKIRKYFESSKMAELIEILRLVALHIVVKRVPSVCRDPKDDFLLEMARKSKARYLITGDQDLLELKQYGGTRIISVREFVEFIIDN